MGSAGAVLDYSTLGAGATAPTAFDLELVSERTRWLRRRFLWFCAVSLVLQVLVTVGFASDMAAAPPVAFGLNVVDLLVVGGGYLFAFAYVLRARPDLATLLRLGMYVAAIIPCFSMLFMRVDMTLNPASWDFGKLPSGAVWALVAPFSIVMGHTIACLFIPWTVRECLRPITVVLFVNSLIITSDLVFTIKTAGPRWVAFSSMVGTVLLAPTPGLLVCWWRYSRFRKRFRLVFESTGYRQLQHELAGARRVHESSLPPQNFLTSGPVRLAYVYEPMRQIGGDILYVHPPDDPKATTLSVLLVDVNGHGFGAALMANRVIGEIQRLYAENPAAAPHEILCALNRYVLLTMAKNACFATAVCFRLDTVNETLEYANGGHPPALLRRRDGSTVRLEPQTYLLGVHPHADYCPQSERYEFGAGDALLAYTDGASEARNPAGEMLGIGGLAARFGAMDSTPERWPQALLYQIIDHRRASAEDDTLLVSVYRG